MSPSGVPISRDPKKGSGGGDSGGEEIELTAQNAAQILQSPGVILLQAGSLSEAVSKKIHRLRAAADNRLPVVRLNCELLPQVCQALQIRTSPTLLLMSKGQVKAALEQDLSPPTVTAFVEAVAKMLGLKVDLAEDITEHMAGAEEVEWSNPAAAEEVFAGILQLPDVPQDARVRAAAGSARCAARQPQRLEEAKAQVSELEAAGHLVARTPEVRQAVAIVRLAEVAAAAAVGGAAPDLEKLQAASSATPADFSAVQACTVALFWAGKEGEAVDAGLRLLRSTPRSEEARQLVLTLVEALGPRHPRSASARRAFSNALFI